MQRCRSTNTRPARRKTSLSSPRPSRRSYACHSPTGPSGTALGCVSLSLVLSFGLPEPFDNDLTSSRSRRPTFSPRSHLSSPSRPSPAASSPPRPPQPTTRRPRLLSALLQHPTTRPSLPPPLPPPPPTTTLPRRTPSRSRQPRTCRASSCAASSGSTARPSGCACTGTRKGGRSGPSASRWSRWTWRGRSRRCISCCCCELHFIARQRERS